MLAKLKHEWKTAALGVATFLVGIWDAGASTYDFSPIVPEHFRPYVPLALGIGFLVLRRWTPPRC